ncbi:MAG TPA: L-threonylcarbamoyladenylate synthase [Thermoanaerobaculia bacterium]|jgi:L-threonylcarbamoyladenylate synthase|nr:L-threonylcarbamoyladenylate synthase [Thermoanaerobaculia bacterium]
MPAPDKHQIADAIAALERGGVVLMPTDTIYGLHARATDARATQRIAEMKGRDEEKPFVVIGASIAQLESLGSLFSERARSAVSELWPGPLTAIVALRAPIAASRGASTIALRVPALPWLRELLERSGPLASTSANRSGEPPLLDPKTVSFPGIDFIIDNGPQKGKASTIVDFTGDEPRFIREGESFFTQKVWKTLRKSL